MIESFVAMFPNGIIQEIFLAMDNIVDSYYFAKTNQTNYSIFKHLQAIGLKKLPEKVQKTVDGREEIMYISNDKKEGKYSLRIDNYVLYASYRDNYLSGQKIEYFRDEIKILEYKEGDLCDNYYIFEHSGLLVEKGSFASEGNNPMLEFYPRLSGKHNNFVFPVFEIHVLQICNGKVQDYVIKKTMKNYFDIYSEIRRYYNENKEARKEFERYFKETSGFSSRQKAYYTF